MIGGCSATTQPDGGSSNNANFTRVFAGGKHTPVFWSKDSGITWTQGTGLGAVNFVLAVTPNGTDVFELANLSGLYKSTDFGTSWVKIMSLTQPMLGFTGFGVFGKTMLAGWDDGAYLSSDGGITWSLSTLHVSIGGIYSFAKLGNVILACTHDGLQKSNDDGVSWSYATNINQVNEGSVIISTGSALYVGGAHGGLWRSYSFGASWQPTNLNKLGINAIAQSGSNLWAGTDEGLFQSGDDGATWSQIDLGSTPIGTGIHGLAVSGSYLFAATEGQGLLRSTDFGSTWTKPDSGLTDPTFNCVSLK